MEIVSFEKAKPPFVRLGAGLGFWKHTIFGGKAGLLPKPGIGVCALNVSLVGFGGKTHCRLAR